jgi:hypothetical protein
VFEYGIIIFTIPNAGIINTYTSGCPKNQNKCWYKILSPPYINSKNVVCQCRSHKSIIIAAASTGVINANIRIVNKRLMVINGNKILRLRRPGMLNVRLVINKFVNEIVVLIPAKITLTIAIS